jgi:hypothetical protein
MVTAIETKYNCLCGFGTDEVKEFRTHLFTSGRKEKGLHKSLNQGKHPIGKRPIISLPFKQKEVPVPEASKTPLQKLQDELAVMNQRAVDLAAAIEKEAAEEAKRQEAELKRQLEAENQRIAEAGILAETVTWKPKANIIAKPTRNGKPAVAKKTACIIIDHKRDWHGTEMIDLKGQDVSDCMWGYYGKRYPVLVETDDKGGLKKYLPNDTALGESPHRLYIAAKSSAYKSYMHIDSDLLKKIQIGLMALLVVGILFLIYIIATTKPSAPATDTMALNILFAWMGV